MAIRTRIIAAFTDAFAWSSLVPSATDSLAYEREKVAALTAQNTGLREHVESLTIRLEDERNQSFKYSTHVEAERDTARREHAASYASARGLEKERDALQTQLADALLTREEAKKVAIEAVTQVNRAVAQNKQLLAALEARGAPIDLDTIRRVINDLGRNGLANDLRNAIGDGPSAKAEA